MRHVLLAVVFACSAVASAATQAPPGNAAPTPPPPPVSGQRGQPPPAMPVPPTTAPTPPTQGSGTRGPAAGRNIRLDITITDSLGANGPTKKTATLIVLSGRNGQVRSQAPRSVINVDALPSELPDGRVMLMFTLEYRPELQEPQTQVIGQLNESLTVALIDGKPMIVTQSADPQSDRRVTVEVTATVMK